MKMPNLILYIATALFFTLSGFQAVAQEEEQEAVQYHRAPVQFGFITPLGTNGLESWETINNISINMIAGISRGVEGIELAGFANVTTGDMRGVQVAGFCNNTFGEADGMEIAGFSNYNHRDVTGIQGAGFANVAIGKVKGFQVAGFSNYARGAHFGQASGFANMNSGDNKGVQLAGFANITQGTMTGIQASGFINYAKRVNGLQIGYINVADTVERGLPIGFFSFVKNGYRAWEIGGNETVWGQVSFKSGTDRFYNIFSVGTTIRNNSFSWAWGYGLGTILPVMKRLDVSVEAVAYHLNRNRWFSSHMSMVDKLNLTVNLHLTKHFTVYAGPSFNVSVTNTNYYDSPVADSWVIYQRDFRRNTVAMYPGFSAGVRISRESFR